MPHLLILYDTTEGQTRKISERMGEVARDLGFQATVTNIRDFHSNVDFASLDAIILGGSIHVGRHSPALERFVIDHRSELQQVRSAFFSVSLSAAGNDDQKADALRAMQQFLKCTGWTPEKTETFAGAILYREYSFWKRWLMKYIAKRAGGDTDTSRDHEYTDWSTVERFATSFLRPA